MDNKFFILFEARSGSSHLVSLLNSSPEILCYSEIFTGQDRATCEQLRKQLNWGEPLHLINPWVLDDHGSVDPHKKARAVGFKTKPYDLPYEHFLGALSEDGFKLILLSRRNLIKQAISRATGLALRESTGLYNAEPGKTTISRIVVDPREIIEVAEICREVQTDNANVFDSWPNSKMRIEYENLVNSELSVLTAVCKFLDVPTFPFVSKTAKNTPDDLKAVVENYAELANALKNHPFERYLTDEI